MHDEKSSSTTNLPVKTDCHSASPTQDFRNAWKEAKEEPA
jgi:hypothetical protein